MITVGTKLKLLGGDLCEVTQFFFKIGEESGSWEGIVEVEKEDETRELIPLFVFESLLRDGLLYPPEKEEFMVKLHKIREEKKNEDSN